jgi:hypothetical protein
MSFFCITYPIENYTIFAHSMGSYFGENEALSQAPQKPFSTGLGISIPLRPERA